MRLIDDWQAICRRAWSIRVSLIGGLVLAILQGAELIWPALSESMPKGLYTLLGIVICVGQFAARLVKQPETDE